MLCSNCLLLEEYLYETVILKIYLKVLTANVIQFYPILLAHSRCSYGFAMSHKWFPQLASQAQSNFYLFTYVSLKYFCQKMFKLETKMFNFSG